MRRMITAVIAAAALALSTISIAFPTAALADGDALFYGNGVEVTDAQMEDARGGYYIVVLIGARLAIKYCSSPRQVQTCAAAANGIYQTGATSIAAVKRWTCSRYGRWC